MRREDQHRILAGVESRVINAVFSECAQQQKPIEEVLADCVYQQRRRAKDGRRRHQRQSELFWDGVQRRLGRADDAEQRQLLSQVVGNYIAEVRGNFDPRVYKIARRALPPLVSALLTASSPKRLASRAELAPLEDSVIVQGETEHLRRLREVGTVILAPTHVSNLDSVILALAISQLNLPPFIYGAAQDLFNNPLLSFFLHNLGAYTVDRLNQDPVYKRVLKTYAMLTLEHGYDNLFFPGGVRSRSGAVEKRLKLGLVGTSIPAYIHNLQRHAVRPKLFVVPATLSYQLVLEAETLIDDFLQDVGKSRYIITDDEFSRPRRVFDFVSQLFGMDSKIYLTLSRGLDPFGNPVDEDGESLAPSGKIFDCSRHVMWRGVVQEVPERDREYTHDLGDSLRAAYSRDNVLQATHVSAYAIFSLMRASQPQADWLRLIRIGNTTESYALKDVYNATQRLLQALKALEQSGRLRLAPVLRTAAVEDVVSDGLRHFAIYHAQPAAKRRGDRIFPLDRALLFYYQNRLDGYVLPPAQVSVA